MIFSVTNLSVGLPLIGSSLENIVFFILLQPPSIKLCWNLLSHLIIPEIFSAFQLSEFILTIEANFQALNSSLAHLKTSSWNWNGSFLSLPVPISHQLRPDLQWGSGCAFLACSGLPPLSVGVFLPQEEALLVSIQINKTSASSRPVWAHGKPTHLATRKLGGQAKTLLPSEFSEFLASRQQPHHDWSFKHRGTHILPSLAFSNCTPLVWLHQRALMTFFFFLTQQAFSQGLET